MHYYFDQIIQSWYCVSKERLLAWKIDETFWTNSMFSLLWTFLFSELNPSKKSEFLYLLIFFFTFLPGKCELWKVSVHPLDGKPEICAHVWTNWRSALLMAFVKILGDPEVTANVYCKSRNLPNTDTQNYSTDLR